MTADAPRPRMDLLLSPWIAVAELGTSRTYHVGLREFFDRAHELVLTCSGPENASLIRLLSAIYDAAAGPTNTAEWDRAWEAETLDRDRISAYFDRWHDRFDVFHPEHPFLQCAALQQPSHGVGHLNLSRCGSVGGAFADSRLSRGVDQHPPMTPVQALLAMLVMLNFDTAGLKTPHPDDKAGKAGNRVGALGDVTHTHITTGGPFKETLLLSLPPAPRQDGDSPAWERPSPGPVHTVRPPTGRLDLLTWPSRRIRLFLDGDDAVSKVAFYPGDRVADKSPQARAALDPMTSWYTFLQGRKVIHQRLPVENQVGVAYPWIGTQLLAPRHRSPVVEHAVAACERGTLDPELHLTVALIRASHTDPKRSCLSHIADFHGPLGRAASLADTAERGRLVQLFDRANATVALMSQRIAAITGRPETSIQAALMMRDLSAEWEEVVLSGGRLWLPWGRTLVDEINTVARRLRLPPNQAERAEEVWQAARAIVSAEPSDAYEPSQGEAQWYDLHDLAEQGVPTQLSPPGTLPPPSRRGRPSQRYVAFGQQLTIRELADHPDAQVGYATIRRRILEGMPAEEAATTPGHPGRGRKRPKVQPAPRTAPDTPTTATGRTRRSGRPATRYEWRGQQLTVAELAALPECSVTVSALSTRLRKGMDIEAAVTNRRHSPNFPDSSDGPQLYEWQGQQLSLYRIAEQPECVVNYMTLHRRVERGMPIDQAATTPSSRGPKRT
ncbi:type I-E CRISPR-associated protein Cse1/CasA [Streptomyces sp. NPDC058368]|uniref:type I-E CRISPR-associated protein Cse1/CasA n=1 Tax=Streptomyces sp. NPDC058368 TaxID=3346461 RepID=UPI00364A3946